MPPPRNVAALVPVAALYRRYAALLLAGTVLLGAWMRAMMVWPATVPSRLAFAHLVHAHSHLGFFGWLVLGIGSALVMRGGSARDARALRALAHGIAVGSTLAFLAFAWQGYAAVSIALSAVQVVLWLLLVRRVWPLDRAEPAARPWFRLALMGLVAAGAATLLPGILKARGVEGGWLRELGIELFLDLFIFGWVIAASFGLLYGSEGSARWSRTARVLFAAGIPPAAFLYVAATPPSTVFVAVGRGGAALVGLGMLLACADLARIRRSALATTSLVSATVIGVLELVAASGVGSALLHVRPVVLAFLHLALLGLATPALLSGWASRAGVVRAVAAANFLLGTAIMLFTLVALGWPWLGVHAARAGIDVARLLLWCFGGGAMAAIGLLLLTRPAVAAGARTHEPFRSLTPSDLLAP